MCFDGYRADSMTDCMGEVLDPLKISGAAENLCSVLDVGQPIMMTHTYILSVEDVYTMT